MSKAKNKTIIMPVGEKAGKKVSLPAEQADEIIKVFGSHKESIKSEVDNSDEVAALESEVLELTKERDQLKADLEELTKPKGWRR